MDSYRSIILRPLLTSLLVLFTLASEVLGLSPDGEALINFRQSIANSDGVLLQWRPEDPDPCGWKGVLCDPKSKRVTSLSLPNHKLSGSLSPDIGKLQYLQFIALHDNFLYGTIPSELGNCSELQSLYLQNNYLSGRIPSELGNISQLQCLDLSSNSLSGSIPSSLGKLNKLKVLNVSTNFLSGKIPSEGRIATFPNNSFFGNRLCGEQLEALCKNEDGSTFSLAPNSVDVSGGASIVMFHGDLPYSSKDIIKKLETLNEEHVIGSGGFGTVYRLAMDDGNVFALKRIVNVSEGFDRFFGRELEILGKRSERLDFDARLNIIIGAAKGLAYLHHDCSPRIIHRDIKSSNILLDSNFEARVSDFGLAKLLGDEESHITTIVAGTFGYLAPEYMQSGRATEKTDVYSFGVLVLEIISGKRPTDASFIEKGLNIVGWLNFLVTENRPKEIVDPDSEGVQAETLDVLLSLAIQCVSSAPEDRPTMHRVVQRLESEVMTPCPSDFDDSYSD
ncbi:hypothetical protein Leryth_000521 [Lithospermum erythrorhizon]|nr:hypothetical protein Leryth_000521 [Lithospermum erythrorhizon]